MHLKAGRPSPAMIVAAVALTFAMIGTAVAADPVAKLTKSKVRKIANKEITKRAPGLSVLHAKTADSAKTATSATAAQTALSAETAKKADTADHATTADSATTATSATTAGSADDAGKVDGFDANQLVRATSATAGDLVNPCSAAIAGFDNFASGTFTTAVSKSVTAPVAGILHIVGRSTAEKDNSPAPPAGANLTLQGRLTVDGAQVGAVGEQGIGSEAIQPCGDTGSLPLEATVPVTAGAHTVALQLRRAGGTAAAFVGNASFSTIFVPFGNAGTQGVLAPSETAASGGDNRP